MGGGSRRGVGAEVADEFEALGFAAAEGVERLAEREVAEADGFEAIVTTDQNLRYQQNLAERRLAILVLLTTDWRLIRLHTDYVVIAVDGLASGDYVELPIPPVA